MITFLIIVGVILLIGAVRIGGTITYRNDVFNVKVRICGIPITIYPKKQRDKKTTNEKKTKKQKAEKRKIERSEIKEWIVFARDMLLILKRRFPHLWRSFAVTRFYGVVIIATSDAAQTADLYGKTCAVVSALYPVYMEALHIKKHDVTIDVDFSSDKLRIEAEIKAHITLGALLVFVLTAGYGALKGFLKMNNRKNLDKAVQNNE